MTDPEEEQFEEEYSDHDVPDEEQFTRDLEDDPRVTFLSSEEEVADFLDDILQRKAKHKRKVQDQRTAITSTLDEFAPSYIFLGFDFNGEEIKLSSSSNTQEKYGLEMLLQRYVSEYFTKRGI